MQSLNSVMNATNLSARRIKQHCAANTEFCTISWISERSSHVWRRFVRHRVMRSYFCPSFTVNSTLLSSAGVSLREFTSIILPLLKKQISRPMSSLPWNPYPSKAYAGMQVNLSNLTQTQFVSHIRFAVQSTRFCDAYPKGLTRKQVAWASKKY